MSRSGSKESHRRRRKSKHDAGHSSCTGKSSAQNHNHIGPGLFSSIGRTAEGVLRGGYNYNNRLHISARSYSGLTISSTLAEKKGVSDCNVTAQYAYTNKDTTLGVGVYAMPQKCDGGQLAVSITAGHKYKNTMINYKFYPSPHFSIQHLHKFAALSLSGSVKKSAELRISGTLGTPVFAFGMDANYNAARNGFSEYKAGFRVTKGNSEASVLLTQKNDLVAASYAHKLSWPKRITVAGEVKHRFSTSKSTLTIGGSCVLDRLTTLKLSIGSHGELSTYIQHKITSNSSLTISSMLDMKALNKVPKTGLALVFTL